MNFWELKQPSANVAVVEAENNAMHTYCHLQATVAAIAKEIDCSKKTLGFIFCKNNLASLCGYLASLQQKQAVYLLDAHLEHSFVQNLIDRYHPDWLWLPEGHERFEGYNDDFFREGYVLQKNIVFYSHTPIYPELALLLSTSGSTGSPKLVRLSYDNLQANAESIADYLKITPDERPITTLPMYYSYGLSVINSHLNSGAAILLTEDSIMTESFWNFFYHYGATSLAGVPYTYQMLFRLQFGRLDLPTLKTMTQAGGRLDIKLQHYFSQLAAKNSIRFFCHVRSNRSHGPHELCPP